MNQIIHILKKDLRRFGMEIGLVLALLALYVWSAPTQWWPPDLQIIPATMLLRYEFQAWLTPLLFLGWTVLMVRAVQEESPAGDRQFWVTRPYEWPKLLAAKALFMLLVMNLPLLIAQIILLAIAGFAPFPYISGLLYRHLLLLFWFLPLGAFAVVTAGMAQVWRTILFVLVFFAAFWWLASLVPDASAWHGSSVWDWLQYGLLLGVPVTVIVRQYFLRKTVQARFLLLAGGMAMMLLTAATPYGRLIEKEYPLPAAGEGPVFRLNLYQPTPQTVRFYGKEAAIPFELSAGGVRPGYVADINAIRVSLVAPDGTRWNSGWQPMQKTLSWDTRPETGAGQNWWEGLNFVPQVDRKMFERLKDVPVRVRFEAAATVFRDRHTTRVTQTRGEFDVPGLGICEIGNELRGLPRCRAPLRRPAMIGLSARLFQTCPPQSSDSGVEHVDWTSSLFFGSGEFGLNPVILSTPNVSFTDNSRTARGLCPGSPLTFKQPDLVGRIRVVQEFDGIKLGGER